MVAHPFLMHVLRLCMKYMYELKGWATIQRIYGTINCNFKPKESKIYKNDLGYFVDKEILFNKAESIL